MCGVTGGSREVQEAGDVYPPTAYQIATNLSISSSCTLPFADVTTCGNKLTQLPSLLISKQVLIHNLQQTCCQQTAANHVNAS